jgi:RecB family exonuclease
MARWTAQYFKRTSGFQNEAANLGTTVHSALEHYVKAVYIDKEKEASLEYLLKLFQLFFTANFGSAEGELYIAGVKMLKEWFARTDFSDRVVISAEQKLSFDVPTSAGKIQFNYIIDRLDQIGDGVYEVVDYKTSAWALQPSDLDKKIQARIYALAIQILYPDAKRIFVTFDMLRHQSVGRVFTREQNIATWKRIKSIAERIIAADENNPEYTLNTECNFCPIKATCPEITKSVDNGGIYALDFDEMVDRRVQLDMQRRALNAALTEIDKVLTDTAREADITEFETEESRLFFKVSRRRSVDADQVEEIVGPEMFSFFGGRSMTLPRFEALMEDPSLTPEQVKKLNKTVAVRTGEPTISVVPRDEEDEL